MNLDSVDYVGKAENFLWREVAILALCRDKIRWHSKTKYKVASYSCRSFIEVIIASAVYPVFYSSGITYLEFLEQ